MKTNPMVSKRFEELAEKADAIAKARTPCAAASGRFSTTPGEKADAIAKAATPDFAAKDDGTRFYNINAADFAGWATSVLNLLQRVFGEDSIHFQHFSRDAAKVGNSEYSFHAAVAVFNAAREDYEGGYLFKLESLVKAEAYDDVLEQASGLLSAGYKDPACVVAGVALESTLKGLCDRHGIAHAKLDKMNADLAKSGVYNTGMQKQVTAWADRRNNAAHGNWNEYAAADVEDMIKGITRLIADYV